VERIRTLIATVLLAFAATAGVSAAATTGFVSAGIGSGVAPVAGCDADGFTFSNTVDGSGAVTAVTVGAIAGTCAGGALSLTLSDASGSSIGAGSAALPSIAFTGSATVTVTPQPPREELSAYRAVIVGP